MDRILLRGRLSNKGGTPHSVDMRLLISGVIYLTVSLPSLQSGWKEIGKTAGNNTVYVDPRSVKTVKGITTARIQVRFAQVVSGAGWKLSRHAAMMR